MMQGRVFGVLCACLLLSVASGQGVGFKTSLTQSGLNYLTQVGMQLLQQKLANIQIPDLSGDAKAPVVGDIDWSLTNIVLTSSSISSATISTIPGTGLNLAINGLSAEVTMNWSYKQKKFPHLKDSGSADITVSGATASVALQIVAQAGRPVANVESVAVAIGNLQITLHGGASWLYDFFMNVLHGQIQNAVQNALQNAITQSVSNGLNHAFSQLPIEKPINSQVEISFELTQNPEFTSAYLTLPVLGEFYSIASPSECPSPYCVFSSIPDVVSGQMVQMVISDFVANSAGYVFFKLGQLHAVVQDSSIPSWSPIRLNTQSFQYLIPALYNAYPNKPLEVEVVAAQPPQATFSAAGASIVVNGDVNMYVVEPNGTVLAFTLNGDVSLQGQAVLSGQSIVGNLTFVHLNFTLAQSAIGNFPVAPLDSVLNLLFNSGLIPVVNGLLEQGFPLPVVPGVQFINPSIQWGADYLAVSTDINYTPTHHSQANRPTEFAKKPILIRD